MMKVTFIEMKQEGHRLKKNTVKEKSCSEVLLPSFSSFFLRGVQSTLFFQLDF